MSARSEEQLADVLSRRPASAPVIVYLTVTAVAGSVVTVDFDGVPFPIPYAQCFGCGGVAPTVGQTVAIHVNGTQLVLIGRHL